MNAVGDMVKEVEDLVGESVESSKIIPLINDAVHNIWSAFMSFAMHQILGGPVAISFAAGDERREIVSVLDPTSAPTGSTFVGGALPLRDYSVSYTLVTDSGSETLESPVLSQNVAANSLSRINPPSFVDGAMGWNLYAGSVGARRAKQNDAPLDFSQSFDESPSGYVDDPNLPAPPLKNTTGDDISWIRFIEVQTPDGARKSWFASDLNSDMMRRFSRAIPINSPFQGYAWDLINSRVVEVRPPIAGAIDGRYFYVKKPRKIRFENSQVPLADFPACWSFIKFSVASIVSASNREYADSREWKAFAAEQKMAAMEAMTSTLFDRDLTVTPYLR